MKERHTRNSIDIFYDAVGTKLTTDTRIKKEIKDFYTGLIGTASKSLQGIDQLLGEVINCQLLMLSF